MFNKSSVKYAITNEIHSVSKNKNVSQKIIKNNAKKCQKRFNFGRGGGTIKA
jgi:hypothetical protein